MHYLKEVEEWGLKFLGELIELKNLKYELGKVMLISYHQVVRNNNQSKDHNLFQNVAVEGYRQTLLSC